MGPTQKMAARRLGFLSLDKIFIQLVSSTLEHEKLYPILDTNALIYVPYPRVNCLKTIPFTAARTYIAHIWQYPLPGGFWPGDDEHFRQYQL